MSICWTEDLSICWTICRGIVVIAIAQLHSTRPELRFWAVSNHAHVVSKIHGGEDSRLKIKLNTFRRSTTPQKQFIIIIIIITVVVIIRKQKLLRTTIERYMYN